MKRLIVLATVLGVTVVGGGLASAGTGDDSTPSNGPICIGSWDDEHPDGRNGICINLPLGGL